MNRLTLVLATCGLLMIAPGIVEASIGPGTWTLYGEDAGWWQEPFYGGGPGQPGNELSGGGLGYTFYDIILQSVVTGTPPYDYQTTFTGGDLVLTSEGPWGGDATITLDTITQNSFLDSQSGALTFDLRSIRMK